MGNEHIAITHKISYTGLTLNHPPRAMSRKQRIHDAISQELKPDFLAIDDESPRHRVPKDAETHFKIVAVSSQFENLSRIARHRLVHALIASEFETGLHALTLHLYTPSEWRSKSMSTPSSPACRDGRRHDD